MSQEMKTQEKNQRERTLPFEETMRRYPGRFVNMTDKAKAFVMPSAMDKDTEKVSQQKEFEQGEKALDAGLRRNYPELFEE